MCPCRLLPSRVSSLALSRVSSLALQGVFSCPPLCLAGCFFCNGVVSSDVAKPGEVASFYCWQHGGTLAFQEVSPLVVSHIHLPCIRQLELRFEADVSALPDGVKS